MKKIFTFVLGCLMATSMMAQGAKEAYTVFDADGKKPTYYYDDQKDSREGTAELLSDEDRWAYYEQVETIVIDESFKDYKLTSTKDLFGNGGKAYYLSNATSIEGLENINTSEVTDMSYMFYYMSSLEYLDLSGFNTEKVTNMSYMFASCSNLKGVNLRSTPKM